MPRSMPRDSAHPDSRSWRLGGPTDSSFFRFGKAGTTPRRGGANRIVGPNHLQGQVEDVAAPAEEASRLQPASQSVSQSVSQSASQPVSQSVREDTWSEGKPPSSTDRKSSMRPVAEVAQDVRSFLAELEGDDVLVEKKTGVAARHNRRPRSCAKDTLGRKSKGPRTSISYGNLLLPGDTAEAGQRARTPDMKRIEALARPRRGPGSRGYEPSEEAKPKRKNHGPSLAWVERRAQPKKVRDRDEHEPIVYLQDRGVWSQPSGGKFNESRPKSWIDWNVYLSRNQPGPAAYAPNLAPNLPKGGKFNAARTPSALDVEIMRARDMPGPVSATGQIPSTLGTAGVGKVSMARGKTYIDWEVLRSRDLPGPGQYSASAQPSSGGVRFGNHNPKSELDTIIYNARELPGPSEYYPERSYIGR